MAGKTKQKKSKRQKRKAAQLRKRVLLRAEEKRLLEAEQDEVDADEDDDFDDVSLKDTDEEDSTELADIIERLSDEDVDKILEGVTEDLDIEEKHYTGSPHITGATSFTELEEGRAARLKTQKARDVAWDAEDIISNVIRDPMLKTKQKTQKISKAASDMEARINSVLGETKEIEPIIDPTPREAIAVLLKSIVKRINLRRKPEDSSAFMISKDLNDDLRWVGKVTNRWQDRDLDILTDASHKEFIGYLDKNPDMAPPLLPWHNLKSPFTHPTDSWMYKNGFVIFSGKLEEAEAKSLIDASEKTKLGMSHGFFALERDIINRKNITKYRTFEVSVLPSDYAANPFTDLSIIAKEAQMLKKEFLKDLLSEEKYKKLIEDTGLEEKILDESGVQTKEVEQTEALPDGAQEELIKQIGAQLGLPELSTAFEGMVKDMKSLRKGSDMRDKVIEAMAEQLGVTQKEKEDELAEMVKPPAAEYSWMKKASSSEDNLVKEGDEEDDKLVKDAPKLDTADNHWLSQSTHTQPIKATAKEVAALT